MENNKTPSLIKIIRTDYYAFLSFLFLVIIWGFFILFQLFGYGNPDSAFIIVLAVSALAIAVGIWRIQTILALFSIGIELSATVTEIWFFRGRGRIDCKFTYRGHDYLSGSDVVPTRDAKNLGVGDRLNVIVDPDNPTRSMVLDLFV